MPFLRSGSGGWALVEYEDEIIYLCKKKAVSGIFKVGAHCNVKYKNGCKYPATILMIGNKRFCEDAILARQSPMQVFSKETPNNIIFPQTIEESEELIDASNRHPLHILSKETRNSTIFPQTIVGLELVDASKEHPLQVLPKETLNNTIFQQTIVESEELVDVATGHPLQVLSKETQNNTIFPQTVVESEGLVDASKVLPLQVLSEETRNAIFPQTIVESEEQVDASKRHPLQVFLEESQINSLPQSAEAVQLVNFLVNTVTSPPVQDNFDASLDSDTDTDYVPCSNSDDSDTEKKLSSPLEVLSKETLNKTIFPQMSAEAVQLVNSLVNTVTSPPVQDNFDASLDSNTDTDYVPCSNSDDSDTEKKLSSPLEVLSKETLNKTIFPQMSAEAVQLLNTGTNPSVQDNFDVNLDNDMDPDYVPCSSSDDSDTEKKLSNPLQVLPKETLNKTIFPQISAEAVQLVNTVTNPSVQDNFDVSLDSDTDTDYVPCSNSDDSDTEKKFSNPLQVLSKETLNKTIFPQISAKAVQLVNTVTNPSVQDNFDVNLDNDMDPDYVPCSSSDDSDTENKLGNSTKNLAEISPSSKDSDLISGPISNAQVFRSNNKNNIRKWDKRQSCLYCGSLELKLPRHLERRHREETEVQKFLSMKKGCKERAVLLKKLRNVGNFKHNSETLIKNSGKIIPLRRPNTDVAVEQYQPCDMCNAMFKKNHLWRHRGRCSGKRNEDNHRSRPGRITQPYSRMLLPVPEAASKGLRENVLSRMNSDIVYLACRNDTTILKYGSKLYQKHGHEPHLHLYVSEKLREVGRFLLSARKTDNSINELKDCLMPSQFNNVVTAVKDLCGFNSNSNKYSIPSLALKIGHALKKCAMIIKSDAIIKQNEELKNSSELFINLCEMEWASEVSSRALATLEENKWNKLQLLPFAEDLSKLHQHLEKTAKQWKQVMLTKPTVEGWRQLCEVTLARVLLFNRKRSGEAERIKIETFEKRDKTATSQTEIQECLTEFERKLSQSITLLEVRGKRGRKVPILLTKEMMVCVELLIEHRSLAGVSTNNDYIFAKSKFGSNKPIRGGDVLRKFTKECNAKHPTHITSTKLRKHVATLSQVMNLKENELDNLASFLGHDIRVHREYYRLPQSTIYLAKVSKILLAVEKGNVQAYKGLSLDEINVDDFCISEESEGESAEECDQKQDDRGRTSEVRNEDKKSKIRRGQRSKGKYGEGAKQKMNKTTHSVRKGEQRKQDCSDSDSDDVTQPPIKKLKGKRVPWSREEASAVKRHLSHFIALLKVPGKRECEECLSKERETLEGRTWKNIKFFVYNMITTKKRQMKNVDQ